MATRDEILSYAGEYLELESYRDYGPMGLQVVASVDTRVLDLAPPPWVIADMLKETGPTLFAELKCDFDAALAARQPYRKIYRHGGHALETEVELDWVRESSGKPGRSLGHGDAPLSGYAPAGMFRRIIERQVYGKAARRQAATATTRLRGLVVDLSRSGGIAADLRQPAHRRQALEVLREVDPTRYGLDFIVFSSPLHGAKPPRGAFCRLQHLRGQPSLSRRNGSHVQGLSGGGPSRRT